MFMGQMDMMGWAISVTKICEKFVSCFTARSPGSEASSVSCGNYQSLINQVKSVHISAEHTHIVNIQ